MKLGRYRYHSGFHYDLRNTNFASMMLFEGLPRVDVIADDILVYASGETLGEANLDHDRNMEKLMERAQEKNPKFNQKKARLRMSEALYMGH